MTKKEIAIMELLKENKKQLLKMLSDLKLSGY